MTAASALIRLPSVLQIVGLGRSMWLELVKNKRAPQPIKIGRATCWKSDEVYAWVGQRVKDSRSATPITAKSAVAPLAEHTQVKGTRDTNTCAEDELVTISFAVQSMAASLEEMVALLRERVR